MKYKLPEQKEVRKLVEQMMKNQSEEMLDDLYVKMGLVSKFVEKHIRLNLESEYCDCVLPKPNYDSDPVWCFLCNKTIKDKDLHPDNF